MANRSNRFQLKHNSTITGSTLPSSDVLIGEPLVNLYDGIMYFSGAPGSTSYTTGNTNTGYFEVGSHLTNLRLDGLITSYSGVSGLGLENKILSGTSQGFVLVDSSNINGISAFTYTASANTFTIYDSNGTNYPASFTSVSGLTVNGDFDVTGSTILNTLTANTISATSISADTVSIGGSITVQDLTVLDQTILSGETYHYNDIFITGDTEQLGSVYISADTTCALSVDGNVCITGDTTQTGDTNLNGDLNITGNTEQFGSVYISADTTCALTIDGNLCITGNTTQLGNFNVTGDTVLSGTTVESLTVNNLNDNLVVYTTNGGTLTTDSEFQYIESANTLNIGLLSGGNLNVNNTTTPATFGDGGVTIGSGGSTLTAGTGNLIIHGNLTVFGDSISAFTSNLFVEDPQITLNYNPTGDTTPTSVNSGFLIQDGSGISGQSVNFDIVRMIYLTGLTSTETPILTEYNATTGYPNRGWITQLNDIVIRSTDPIDDQNTVGSFNGVRVLAEFDILDGGSY